MHGVDRGSVVVGVSGMEANEGVLSSRMSGCTCAGLGPALGSLPYCGVPMGGRLRLRSNGKARWCLFPS